MIQDYINKNKIIKLIKPALTKESMPVYLVGGYIRDILLGKTSSDIDIAVPAGHACNEAKNLADTINGYFIELDAKNKIYRVVLENKSDYIDIADCAGENIEQDLLRRDFTINAIAYELNNDRLVDICGGQKDLENKIIKEISVNNLLDDPIRLLRAFRFRSTLGFSLSDTITQTVKIHAALLDNVAKERVNTELVKLFGGEYAVEALTEMEKLNLLEHIFPETAEIRNIPPNSHHHLGLLEHSIETVRQVQNFYDNTGTEVKEHLDEDFGAGQRRLAYLKIAAFLHDVGKPSTWQIEPETGRHRFIKHDQIGAEIILPTLRKLKFSKKHAVYIQKIIKNHIYPAGVVTSDEAGEKAYLRFYRKMENEVIDLIAIAYADRMSALGEDVTQEMIEKNINGLNKLLEGYLKLKSELKPLPKLLDGNEIMRILNIPASKELGKIIEQLKEAQMSSEVTTKEQAAEYIKKIHNIL